MRCVGARNTKPAAEIQQNLLPPRLARVDRADVAGGVLPGYDVGGDFFDYAANADGLWLVVADATGKGNSAAALSSLAIGALRAARRAGAGLQEAACVADEAILTLDTDLYLTAVLGSWDADAHLLRWINCGHPTPLVLRADGRVDELDAERTYPLGIRFTERAFPILSAVVGPGDRLLLYSDGVLLNAFRRLDHAGRQLAIACPMGSPRRAFELTGLDRQLPMHETRRAALAAVGAA